MRLSAAFSAFILASSAAAQQPAPRELTDAEKEQQRRVQEMLLKKYAPPDDSAYWARVMPLVVAPAAPSAWQEKERKAYADALALAAPRVVVVPPVVPEGAEGIDVTARITMGRLLARELEGEVGDIPDPGLVFRMLGEPRSMTVAEIHRRLHGVNPEWLVTGTAQQDGPGKMRVTWSKIASRIPGSAEVPPAARAEAAIGFGSDSPPELQFAPHAAAAAQALGYAAASKALPIRGRGALALPEDPARGIPADEGTLAGVWMQQLLGALHVPYLHAFPRPQERAYERALAMLIALPKDAPDRAVLLARALAKLDRRAAALKVLAEGTGTPEEKALAAYLNSDLPALAAAVEQVKRPAARLVSQLELAALRFHFRRLSQGELKPLVASLSASIPRAWQPVVSAYVLGLDLWSLPSPANLKLVLDRSFPLAGYSAEDVVRGKIALGTGVYDAKTQAALDLSPLVHAQKWREANLPELCCRGGAGEALAYGPANFLDLLEADADRLAMARLEFLAEVQGRPEQALQLAMHYDEVLFAGEHPGVVHQRLMALGPQVGRVPPNQRGRIALEAFEHARKILTWETVQGPPSLHASQVRHSFAAYFMASQGRPQGAMRLPPPVALHGDVPMRVYWAHAVGRDSAGPDGFAMEASRTACENSVLHFQACGDYLDKLKSAGRRQDIDGAIAALVEPRFKGHPERFELLASRKEEAGDLDGAKALLTEATRIPGAPAQSYSLLGGLLQAQGRFAEASKVYLSYPGLKETKMNVVAMSNYAGGAGLALARRGAPKDARPLLEIAAGNRDGSASSLRAAAQLDLSAGRYREGLALLQRLYQRYEQPGAAAAVIELLLATGDRDNAWSALAQVVPVADTFPPYRAAMLGLRMGAVDEDALLNWRLETLQASSATGIPGNMNPTAGSLADTALFQASVMDREIATLDKVFRVEKWGVSHREPAQPSPRLAPAAPNAQRMAVSHPVGLFMKGYAAFRKADHALAVQEWAELAKQYDYKAIPPATVGYDQGSFWAGMPYYAYALTKAGKIQEAKALPARLTPEGRPAGSPPAFPGAAQFVMPAFDRKLVEGVVAALSGEHAIAQQLLRSAQGSMPEAEARMVPPEYAFVEILDRLSADTGEAGYRDMALAYAKAYQEYSPWSAWAYAYEAVNAPDGPRRTRAVGLALKFDPKSARLAKLDRKTLDAGRAWLRTSDPFAPKKARPPKQSQS